jgi:phosphatidylinositol-3-phosphatase
VGALLLSQYVKAGSVDAADTYNHFSLLKTVEDLFSLKHLGYTTDTSLPQFDAAIFNANQP